MSTKCVKVSIVCLFGIFSFGLFYISAQFQPNVENHYSDDERPETLMLFSPGVQYDIIDQSEKSEHSSEQAGKGLLKSTSLKSFMQVSTTVEDHELHLSGLAVFSKLANAC